MCKFYQQWALLHTIPSTKCSYSKIRTCIVWCVSQRFSFWTGWEECSKAAEFQEQDLSVLGAGTSLISRLCCLQIDIHKSLQAALYGCFALLNLAAGSRGSPFLECVLGEDLWKDSQLHERYCRSPAPNTKKKSLQVLAKLYIMALGVHPQENTPLIIPCLTVRHILHCTTGDFFFGVKTGQLLPCYLKSCDMWLFSQYTTSFFLCRHRDKSSSMYCRVLSKSFNVLEISSCIGWIVSE